MGTVPWKENLDQELDAAQSHDKPLFLDFFNPG